MSWQQLIDIYREAASLKEEAEDQEPIACPNCGWPLEENSEGVLHCPHGDFTGS